MRHISEIINEPCPDLSEDTPINICRRVNESLKRHIEAVGAESATERSLAKLEFLIRIQSIVQSAGGINPDDYSID